MGEVEKGAWPRLITHWSPGKGLQMTLLVPCRVTMKRKQKKREAEMAAKQGREGWEWPITSIKYHSVELQNSKEVKAMPCCCCCFKGSVPPPSLSPSLLSHTMEREGDLQDLNVP